MKLIGYNPKNKTTFKISNESDFYFPDEYKEQEFTRCNI